MRLITRKRTTDTQIPRYRVIVRQADGGSDSSSFTIEDNTTAVDLADKLCHYLTDPMKQAIQAEVKAALGRKAGAP